MEQVRSEVIEDDLHGYPTGVKGYLLWDPHFQKFVISKNVIFDEKSILRKLESMDGVGKIVQDSSE